MISNVKFQKLVVAFILIITNGTVISALCFPSLAISIIAISMVATWIFPLVVVIVSPDISRSNATIQVFGSLFIMLLTFEIMVWQHNSTSQVEVEGFTGLGHFLLLLTGGSLFFIYSMKVAYKANPDTRELHANFFGCPEVVRQCLKALRIRRQHVSDPEYQLLPQEKPRDFSSEPKSRSLDETDSIAVSSPRIDNFVS
ncbi:hypothetical protein DEU56DRAFT_811187 [Suillus clintonianus]|uniref:uncharacterized protein n=1 Tax=Suillus clintonianus TaxID=1904413 RepID=UPI001B865259|nr:uncharacterized protein DEU56DRAFT_811187 [Suillus clintonianus]KAG2133349.1 hypothetical protein DEU56DRAFT_811187 [Suillus clintonianus]